MFDVRYPVVNMRKIHYFIYLFFHISQETNLMKIALYFHNPTPPNGGTPLILREELRAANILVQINNSPAQLSPLAKGTSEAEGLCFISLFERETVLECFTHSTLFLYLSSALSCNEEAESLKRYH